VRRRLRDFATALAVLILLFGILTVINPRVRERVGEVTGDVRSQAWSESSEPLSNAASGALAVTSGYATDNPFLFSFLLVAVVLFLLMVRT
jgi:hypothetical protein